MRNITKDRLPTRLFILLSALIVVVWLVAAWLFANTYVSSQANQLYTATERSARIAIGALYEGLQKTIANLHVVPELSSREGVFQRILLDLGAESDFRGMKREEIQRYLSQNPIALNANVELADVISSIDTISALWIMNKEGITIASSNAGTPESFVGALLSDRNYFQDALLGKQGQQFAVGHMTDVAGFYFSSPVRHGNEVIGAIVSKVKLDYLYYWTTMTNGYVVDSNGVIILASNTDHEMMALPGATVHELPEKERRMRYRKIEFKTLEIEPWPNDLGPHLYTLNRSDIPAYVLNAELDEYRLTLMVAIEGQELTLIERNRRQLFYALAAGGSLLILLVSALTYHFWELQLARKARARQELIEHLASYDALTGLYSRSLTDQLIARGIAGASINNDKFAVLFIDIDHFKDVNDGFGHEAGDEVLKELADRIKSTIKKSDIVIRYGGDEFVVLLHDIKDSKSVETVAANLIAAIGRPLKVESDSLTLTSSIGVALYPEDGETPSHLLRHADTALYDVKSRGNADFIFYKPSMSIDMAARKAMEADMVRALENGEFFLQYQPQYSALKRAIVGCEALIRWRHSSGRIIRPAEFIPVAERSGFIGTLGEFILDVACTQITEWEKKLGVEMPVFVNLCEAQFQRTDMVDSIRRAVREYEIKPHLLGLEVTESMLMADTARAIEILGEIKELGVRVSIDDFGTGYSSLTYLKRFDSEILKIDRAFIRDMELNTNDRSIVNAIISIANDLDYGVIAVGVENRAQFDLLVGMGCYVMQGYLFSSPLMVPEFEEFYRQSLDQEHWRSIGVLSAMPSVNI